MKETTILQPIQPEGIQGAFSRPILAFRQDIFQSSATRFLQKIYSICAAVPAAGLNLDFSVPMLEAAVYHNISLTECGSDRFYLHFTPARGKLALIFSDGSIVVGSIDESRRAHFPPFPLHLDGPLHAEGHVEPPFYVAANDAYAPAGLSLHLDDSFLTCDPPGSSFVNSDGKPLCDTARLFLKALDQEIPSWIKANANIALDPRDQWPGCLTTRDLVPEDYDTLHGWLSRLSCALLLEYPALGGIFVTLDAKTRGDNQEFDLHAKIAARGKPLLKSVVAQIKMGRRIGDLVLEGEGGVSASKLHRARPLAPGEHPRPRPHSICEAILGQEDLDSLFSNHEKVACSAEFRDLVNACRKRPEVS